MSDEAVRTPDVGATARLAALVTELVAEEDRVAELEKRIADANARVRLLSEKLIPDLMDEAQIGLYEPPDKSVRLSVESALNVTPKAEDRPRVIAWLEENGHGALVKTIVSVAMERGQRDAAVALVGELRSRALLAKEDTKVEPATLKKFVKDEIAAGREIPTTLFGVFEYRRAKLERRKPAPF